MLTDTVGAIAPTYTVHVTVAASLPSGGASRASRWNWTVEEDAKLTDTVGAVPPSYTAPVAMTVAASLPSDGAPRASPWNWTVEEDAKLTETVGAVAPVPVPVAVAAWTPEEDAKLTEAVTEFGGNDWVRVAAMVPGRTNKQCRQRWTAGVAPTWTLEEDAKLTEAATEFGGNDWVRVAAMVPGRTNKQCRRRWTAMILDPTVDRKTRVADTVTTASPDDTAAAPTFTVPVTMNVAASLPSDGASRAYRQNWTPEEDAKLIDSVKEYGASN
jgi:myb proto-oncogene protein